MSGRACDDAPMFSVIITTHDRPHFLKEAIASVIAQSVEDFELLVVDDASVPPARASGRDPRIRLIRKEATAGPAASRNEGIKASRGEYLVFLDDDDLFTADRLALGMEGVVIAPISVCFASTLDQRARPWVTDIRRLFGGTRLRARSASDSTHAPSLFPQVGQVTILAKAAPRFDERLRVEEDIDWWIAASRLASPHTVAQLGYIRRVHDRPRVRSKDSLMRALESTQLVLEKNASFFADHPAAAAARWRRIGLFNERLGHRSEARRAFRISAALVRRHASIRDLLRTFLPIPSNLRTRM